MHSVVDSFLDALVPVQIHWQQVRTANATTALASYQIETCGLQVTVTFCRLPDEWSLAYEVVDLGTHPADPGTLVARAAVRLFGGLVQAIDEFVAAGPPVTIVFREKDADLGELYRVHRLRMGG